MIPYLGFLGVLAVALDVIAYYMILKWSRGFEATTWEAGEPLGSGEPVY